MAPAQRVPLALKERPTEELGEAALAGQPLWLELAASVATEARGLLERLEREGDALWTTEGQQSNVRLQRAFHDALGVEQVVFVFCDDLLRSVYELPWWETWRGELAPVLERLGIAQDRVIRCLLARLPAGAKIPVHHDTGLWSTRSHRVHVPLVTSEQDGGEDGQVVFNVGPRAGAMQRVAFRQCAALELNNRAKHAVENNWGRARVHLILDYVEAGEHVPRKRLEPGQTVLQTRRAIFLDEEEGRPFVETIGKQGGKEKDGENGKAEEASTEERLVRTRALLGLVKSATTPVANGVGNGIADTASRVAEFQRQCVRFSVGECTARGFVRFLASPAALGPAGVRHAFDDVEVRLAELVADPERRAALKGAYSWWRQGPRMFVLIGAMKCGTTSLYDYVMQHPDAERARQKEPHFFDWRWDKVQEWEATPALAASARALRTHGGVLPATGADADFGGDLDADLDGDLGMGRTLAMDAALADKYAHVFHVEKLVQRVKAGDLVVTGEATPSYLLGGALVAERVARVRPDMRLLVIVRDPVERAYSHYQMMRDRSGTEEQLQRRGSVADKSFAEFVEQDLARLQRCGALSLTAGHSAEEQAAIAQRFEDEYMRECPMDHGGHSVLGRGMYALQLLQWLRVFPREQFLFLRLDALAADTQREMDKVCAFLGLDRFQVSDKSPKNARSYEPMDPAMRASLEDLFVPHNASLVGLLGPEFDFNP